MGGPGSGRPKKKVPAAPSVPPPPADARPAVSRPSLRAALQLSPQAANVDAPPAVDTPATPVGVVPPPAGQLVPPAPAGGVLLGQGWIRFGATKGTDLFTLWGEGRIRKDGFAPKEADDDDVAAMANTIEAALREIFPELRLPAWIAVPLAAIVVYCGMRVGAQPLALPPKPPEVEHTNGTPPAGPVAADAVTPPDHSKSRFSSIRTS